MSDLVPENEWRYTARLRLHGSLWLLLLHSLFLQGNPNSGIMRSDASGTTPKTSLFPFPGVLFPSFHIRFDIYGLDSDFHKSQTVLLSLIHVLCHYKFVRHPNFIIADIIKKVNAFLTDFSLFFSFEGHIYLFFAKNFFRFCDTMKKNKKGVSTARRWK